MKAIVRRATGENWKAYVARLMHQEGVISNDDEPTDEEARMPDVRIARRREIGIGIAAERPAGIGEQRHAQRDRNFDIAEP